MAGACIRGTVVVAVVFLVSTTFFDLLAGGSATITADNFVDRLVIPVLGSVAMGLGVFILTFVMVKRAIRKKESDLAEHE